MQDPAKVLCDLAVALGLGGDCLADVAVLRGKPDVWAGGLGSDGVPCRGHPDRVLAAIDAARGGTRDGVAAGRQGPPQITAWTPGTR